MHQKLNWLALLTTLSLFASTFSSAVEVKKRPFNIHDMLSAKRVGAPAISADGSRVVFSVKTYNEKTNKSDSDLWLLDLPTGDLKQITHTPRSEGSYQWLQDNKSIIFTRDSTVWKQPTNGNKASKIITLPVDIETMKLSSNGEKLAFTSRVFVDCPNLECTQQKIEQNKKLKTTGKIFQQLFVRHWDKWKDGMRSHLFVMPFTQVDSNSNTNSNTNSATSPIDVTQGWDADISSVPFGGNEEYNFSPDNKTLFFSAKNVGKQESWSTNFDIFQFQLEQPNIQPKNLTINNKAWDTLPLVSPNGKYLAYTSMQIPGYEADRFEIKLVDLKTGKQTSLTQDWDRSISSMVFSTDSQDLLVTTQDVGNKSLYKINLQNGKRIKLLSQGKNSAISLAGKQIIYAHNDLKMPTELFRLPITGGKPQQLTYFNKPLLSKVNLGEYEQFSFKGWNDEIVHGYVVKPADFNPKKKYPLAFLIHGGPQGSFYNQFHYRWNPQIYAGAGYVSIMIDFHGSTGYGQKFTDSIQTDWGGKPLEDLKKGLAAAVKKYPFIDEHNACALGASYGGYMINWIASQWREGFKCLVNHDGVFDNRMMYFSTEELWFVERENKGPYYNYSANFEKHNPVNFVKQWQTPMFVIQGGLDFRIPESQSIGAFTALQRQGIESKFLYFPNENHWVLKPANSVQWHNEVLSWLDKYLN